MENNYGNSRHEATGKGMTAWQWQFKIQDDEEESHVDT